MPLRLPKNLPRILLIIFLLFFFLQVVIIVWALVTPQKTEAQTTTSGPAYSPQCWRQGQCEQNCGLEQGCYWELSAFCTGGTGAWGRCYPKSGPITLAIPFGPDRGTVKDISVYIKYLYEYTVGIGGILATVMIIWGGIVYLTAGGNPGRIGQAKEYISNALIGVVLLFTSYLMLQTLNPDLVKLSMPRSYLIRPISLMDDFCINIPRWKPDVQPPLAFAFAAKQSEPPRDLNQLSPSDYQTRFKLECGLRYYEFLGGNQTCWGLACDEIPNSVCAPEGGDKYTCQKLAIAGSLSGSIPVEEIGISAVCSAGRICDLTSFSYLGGGGIYTTHCGFNPAGGLGLAQQIKGARYFALPRVSEGTCIFGYCANSGSVACAGQGFEGYIIKIGIKKTLLGVDFAASDDAYYIFPNDCENVGERGGVGDASGTPYWSYATFENGAARCDLKVTPENLQKWSRNKERVNL